MDEQNGGNMLSKGILNLGLPMGLSYIAAKSSEHKIDIEKDDLKSNDSQESVKNNKEKIQKGGFGSNLLLESALAIVPMALISLSDSDNEKDVEKNVEKDDQSILSKLSSYSKDSKASEKSNASEESNTSKESKTQNYENKFDENTFSENQNNKMNNKDSINEDSINEEEYNLYGGNIESFNEKVSLDKKKVQDENVKNIKVVNISNNDNNDKNDNNDTKSSEDIHKENNNDKKSMNELKQEFQKNNEELKRLKQEAKEKEIEKFEDKSNINYSE
tara:strand:- start:1998 stop:2822 length:825 start_codon:yes stop_codon:yes gene_type:complete